jgi:hypothetical protein
VATEQEHFDAARQFQEFYDQTLRKIDAKAPSPVLGQRCNDYRRETPRQLKRTFLPEVHPLFEVQYRSLRSDALQALEPQLLRACVEEANNPAHVPVGELKKIERLDEYGKIRCVEFVGQESFVKQITRPGRRVVKFLAPSDSYGRAVRELA